MPHKMMNPQIAYVLHDNRLSIEARMLYAYLCSFDDGVPPSTYQMIRQLGIGKTRFYRYRNELEAFGLIEVENKITSGGGVAKYSVLDVNGDGSAASIYLNKRKGIKACETSGF